MGKRKKDEEKIADQFEWKKCVYAKSGRGGVEGLYTLKLSIKISEILYQPLGKNLVPIEPYSD